MTKITSKVTLIKVITATIFYMLLVSPTFVSGAKYTYSTNLKEGDVYTWKIDKYETSPLYEKYYQISYISSKTIKLKADSVITVEIKSNTRQTKIDGIDIENQDPWIRDAIQLMITPSDADDSYGSSNIFDFIPLVFPIEFTDNNGKTTNYFESAAIDAQPFWRRPYQYEMAYVNTSIDTSSEIELNYESVNSNGYSYLRVKIDRLLGLAINGEIIGSWFDNNLSYNIIFSRSSGNSENDGLNSGNSENDGLNSGNSENDGLNFEIISIAIALVLIPTIRHRSNKRSLH